MSVIDLCSNGVTKSYVRKEINKAVFESGTMTPDSTQQMIDDSLIPYATKSYVDEKIKTVTYYNITNLTKLPSGVTTDDIINGNAVFYYSDDDGFRILPDNLPVRDWRHNIDLVYRLNRIEAFPLRGLNKYFTISEDGSISSTYYHILEEIVVMTIGQDMASGQNYWRRLYSTITDLHNAFYNHRLDLSFSITTGAMGASFRSYTYSINADALKIYYMNFASNKPYVKLTITPDGEKTIEYSSTYVK